MSSNHRDGPDYNEQPVIVTARKLNADSLDNYTAETDALIAMLDRAINGPSGIPANVAWRQMLKVLKEIRENLRALAQIESKVGTPPKT